MAALLVGMAVMSIMLSMALPVWRTAVQREREAELIFRGEQYAHAIELFSRRNGGFPPSLAVLEQGRFIRKLYKDPMTTDGEFQPVYVGQVIAGQPVVPGQPGRAGRAGARGGAGAPAGRAGQPPAAGGRGAAGGFPGAAPPGAPGRGGTIGAGPIIGVVSKSTAQALRLYNGRGRYNEWAFVATATTQQPGAPTGAQTPGMPPGRGRGAQQPGARPGGPPRGQPFPGRGMPPPPGRGFPRRGGPPGAGNPFGPPEGFPPPGRQ
jgi:type II secretory pathway pseudopilin PulG